MDSNNGQLLVGLIAQPVEHCTSIAKVKVRVLFRPEFLRSFSCYCLSSIHNCEDQLLHRNRFHPQFKYMNFMCSLKCPQPQNTFFPKMNLCTSLKCIAAIFSFFQQLSCNFIGFKTCKKPGIFCSQLSQKGSGSITGVNFIKVLHL